MSGQGSPHPRVPGRASFAGNTMLSVGATLRPSKRIVAAKYARGAAFNRQRPFVDVQLSDIVESGEVLALGRLTR